LPGRPVEDDATRRQVFQGAGAVSLAWLLAACGDDQRSTDPAGSPTRTFVDDAGRRVEIPRRPQRIAAIHGRNAGGLVLALGGPVVGIATRDGGLEPAITRYFDVADLPTVGEYSEPDVEALAALRPDVIIDQASEGQLYREPELLARLEQLAPVVGFDVFAPVETVMAKVADFLGTEQAQQRLAAQRAEYESALEPLRGLLGDRWAEVNASSLYFYGQERGSFAVGGPQISAAHNILTDLGVQWTPLVLDAAANSQLLGDLSFERLPEVDGDLLVVNAFGNQGLDQLPLYPGLAAVRAGQVVSIPDDLIGTHYLNYTATADYLREQLAGRELRTDLV